MKNTTVRLMAETAVAAALCSLLLIITMYVPFLTALGVLVCGTPLMYMACKRGIVPSTWALLISFIVVFILTGNLLSALITILSYAIPGFAFGIAVSKKPRTSVFVLATSIAVLAGFLVELAIINGGGDGILNIMNELTAQISGAIQETLGTFNEKLPENLPVIINQLLDDSIKMFMRFLPAVFIIAALGYGYAVSMFGVYFLRRMRVCDVPYRSFSEIRAPRFISSMIFVFYIISVLGNSETIFIAAIDNIILISAAILGVCGLSTIDYYFRKKIPSGMARFFIYVAAFGFAFTIMTFIVTVLPLIGYIDSKGLMRRELEEK